MINITFPDGSVREFPSGITGLEIAKSISEGLARNAVGVVVNNEYYELNRPIESDATLKVATFDDDDGKQMYWHSSAHLLAEAVQELFPGTKFGIGPSIENGFYYDVYPPEGIKISNDDLPKIEEKMRELAKKASTYNMIEMTWEAAYEYYSNLDNEFKLDLLEGLKGEKITFCVQGNFTDLCRGGHIPSTSYIKAVKLLSVAGADTDLRHQLPKTKIT